MAIVLMVAGLALSYQSQQATSIILATTTSTRDTGLLDYLDPLFAADTGIQVQYVAVGTGQALDMAARGDADVAMVHAPSLELPFMAHGNGLCRSAVMYNRFMIVGPASDPAGISGLTNATTAFRKIWQTNSTFISRGDNSGTNVKELAIWARVGYTPTAADDSWYLDTGQGMAATLTVASEKSAYTLTDDGTFYALQGSLKLQILVAGDPFLFNQYHIIVVSPSLHPNVKVNPALEYAHWLVSPRGQALIGAYEIGGHRLFTPDYNPADSGVC
ncbi:MAG TPA: substrate-binding domain-containing protein [Thermoplasmata archaeon]|nr:substrate-binding domain-containing protein [Thermoplasmata archaeon]